MVRGRVRGMVRGRVRGRERGRAAGRERGWIWVVAVALDREIEDEREGAVD